MRSIPGRKDWVHSSKNKLNNHINPVKKKNHIIISTAEESIQDLNLIPIHDKIRNPGIEGILNLRRISMKKTTIKW